MTTDEYRKIEIMIEAISDYQTRLVLLEILRVAHKKL